MNEGEKSEEEGRKADKSESAESVPDQPPGKDAQPVEPDKQSEAKAAKKTTERKPIVPAIRGLSWFERLIPARIGTRNEDKGNVPEGLWVKCDNCSNVLYHAELDRAQDVCVECGHHMLISARKRIERLLDKGDQEEIGASVEPIDMLKFKDSKRYRDRLSQASKDSGEKDALVVVKGKLKDMPVVVAVFDFNFMAGSMGSVVGERFCRACDACLESEIPLICFSASGGARMQEALFSLLQMGKTSAYLRQLADRGLPYVSVLTDPTMGGVSASLAMLGDIIIAEPAARIGFAGRRVIEQTVREKLPEGFQSSEFLLEHGAIDLICDRRDMRDTLSRILAKLCDKPVVKYDDAKAVATPAGN